MPHVLRSVLAGAVVVLVAGCSANGPAQPPAPSPTATPSPSAPPPPAPGGWTRMPAGATTVVEGSAAVDLAVGTSRALFDHAPVVVVAAEGDAAGVARGSSAAVDRQIPL